MIIEDLRDEAHEAVVTAEFEVGDQEQARWPNVDEQRRSSAHAAVVEAHDSIMDYGTTMSAFADTDGERWNEDVVGGHVFPDGSALPVSLEEMPEWDQVLYRDDDEDDPQLEEIRLPVAYSRELLQQADMIAAVNDAFETDYDAVFR